MAARASGRANERDECEREGARTSEHANDRASKLASDRATQPEPRAGHVGADGDGGRVQNRRLATARESALQGRHVRGGEAADARKRDVTYGDVAGDEVTTVDGVTERELQSCERRELPRPDCLLLIASRNRFRLRGRRCRPAPSAADSSHVRYVSAARSHTPTRVPRARRWPAPARPWRRAPADFFALWPGRRCLRRVVVDGPSALRRGLSGNALRHWRWHGWRWLCALGGYGLGRASGRRLGGIGAAATSCWASSSATRAICAALACAWAMR